MRNRLFTLHDFVGESLRIEGIDRHPSFNEVEATMLFLQLEKPTTEDLIALVEVYQPDARPRFDKGMDVRVGNFLPPRGGPHIGLQLDILLANVLTPDPISAFESHIDYETLHPFTDGNGRSGRALWLWGMGGIDKAPLGFLHHFYYQALTNSDGRRS